MNTIRSIVALSLIAILPLAGCNQSTVAALVNELGTASASIAALEGNTQLATQLNADTAAAVKAINAWKPGTPSDMAIQAINIVIDDLNLICGQVPNCGQYGPLIILALGTAQSIITILNAQQPGSAITAKASAKPHTDVHITNPPTDVKEFKKQWNALRKGSPTLQKAPAL